MNEIPKWDTPIYWFLARTTLTWETAYLLEEFGGTS